MLNVILNTMRLYEGIRDNMDGTNARYLWEGWFDTTNELHEIKHMVHSDTWIQVNEDVNKTQEGCWKLVRLNTTSGKNWEIDLEAHKLRDASWVSIQEGVDLEKVTWNPSKLLWDVGKTGNNSFNVQQKLA